MATIQERIKDNGKVSYRVQVRLKGCPPQTATFSRISDARKWIQQVESAIREKRHFKTSESKKHTLRELMNRYINEIIPTKKSNHQEAQLIWWREKLGDYFVADITPTLIAECRDILLKGVTSRGKARSPSTVIRYLAALSHAFNVACREWGWVEDSPLRKVTKPKEGRGRIRFLDTAEREKLLRACMESKNHLLYIIVVLALSTGMRHGEMINLTWRDVDLIRGRITLNETKNGERRIVPLTGKALELLKKLETKKRIDTELLFPGRDGRIPINLRSAWEVAMRRAEIINFRFHDLRHSCASYLAMNKASLAEIAEVLGHKTLQMVKRYAHLSEAHTAAVVKSMNRKIFG